MTPGREQVSRRLKAARWLAGAGRNDRGQLVPLDVRELEEREPLQRNRITANRIRDMEQERVDARELELEAIAEALGVPADWFERAEPLPADEDVRLDRLERRVVETERLLGELAAERAPRGPTERTVPEGQQDGA